MTAVSPPLRNAVVGALVAGGISLASIQLSAGYGCSTSCAPGTVLEGHTIECDCNGPGQCLGISPGYNVRCGCDDWPDTYCGCDVGCS